ncbi:TetR/AcrR family transcriptional regulator [Pedobacter sp. KLB.chiD]|uniref:TetR/AcrR family transcriptional regulator n=1 Tax=Pedobacter sp. KLB.chiD TaxID=3387402 RepID=UPI00399A4EBE
MMLKEKQIEMIEKAEALFADNGYQLTGIRDIAKKVCSNSSMVNYYFNSKENLLRAIINYRTADLEKLLLNKVYQNNTPFEQICQILDTFVNKAFKFKDFHKLLIQLETSNAADDLLKDFYKLRVSIFNHIQAIINTGQQKGHFKKEIDVFMFYTVISGTIAATILNNHQLAGALVSEGIPEKHADEKLLERTLATLGTIADAMLVANH